MNQSKNILRLGICSLLLLGLAACHQNPRTTDAEKASQTQISSTKEASSWKASYSNLNNQVSSEEVKNLLSAHLDSRSVDDFFNLVNDYNTIVG